MSLHGVPLVLVGLTLLTVTPIHGDARPRAEVLELTIRPTPGAVSGEVAAILDASRATGLGALEVELVYDPSLLEALRVTPAPLLAEGLLDHELRPDRVRCVLISGEPIVSDGGLFTVHFATRRDSGQAVVDLENVKAWSHDRAFEMRVTATPCALDLSSPPVEPESPSTSSRSLLMLGACAGVLALVALLVIVYRQGRRRGESG